MTIVLVVGLPGAGKTRRAQQLEASTSALRLTPDDWQRAVFPDDSPTRWRTRERSAQRFRIEGKLIEIGVRAAVLGVEVVLDFGFWSRDERSALRWIADAVGVRARVEYLPIAYDEQRRRITDRYASSPGQFQMTDDELRQWQLAFELPDHDELHGGPIPPPPTGYATWGRWASWFWPSLPDPVLSGAPGP